MSRRNQDLVSRVKFEVDSRMANASMQALQAHAEKLNQQVAEVNASIKALGDVPDDNPALLEYRKQLRRLNSDLKDVNTTMKDYTRGVKAAGELYRHYAMGNIEDMSIKAIRAGVNGMKKRLDNLKAGGDPGDAEEMRLIEAITTEADVVVKRFKTDYQHVVEEIARGGTVTEQTLKRTRDGLADLMQTAETETEKNELTNYWQKVGAAIEAIAVENRRLRGEVADREEAMRIAYATDHDGSQQAIHDAEARADAARRENDGLRQQLDLKQQQRRELEQEMDINSMQQRALMDRRDELKAQEKEDRAIRNQRVDDANKELNAARRAAKTQQQAYDEQKQTVEKLRTEVQGLTDAQTQSSEQLAQKQEKLSQKTAELNQQQDKLNGMVDETVIANQRLARAEQEQTDARNAQAEAKKHEGEAVKKVEDELRGLTDEQLKNAQAYSHLTEEINADTAAMQRNIITEQEATREADRLRSGSIDKMEQALSRLRESNRKLDPTIDKEEWERGERAIGQLTLRLEELKKQSAELRREPVLDMMTQRMQSLGTLSRDALTETKKFWQAMYDGADKNDPKLKGIEQNLKNITAEEERRRASQAERIIGNMGGSSDAEIKLAVQAMEQLRDAQAHGNAEWERFNKLAQEGKKYLEDWATVDSVIKYEGQMQNLARLSDAALTETKKFWETMVAGAEKGSSELREYEAHLEKVKQEERERKELSNKMKAQLVRTGTLGNFSESEIKESIAAAKELQSHMASASPEAKKLADAIANAEEHIKKYGIESARAAKRQQESDEMMRKQLSRMSEDFLHGKGMPSEAALKAQKRYWQQLIDDPKNAGKSLQQYRDSLTEVENLMADMVKINGQTALEWFRNGSDKDSDANKIKEMADRLKAYRDTLPQESEAATIQYIDQLLQKVGASTKKATAELMDFEKAKEIALKAGDDVYGKQNPAFLASPEEIQAATKSIEKYREELFKTIKQKRDMGEATDAEEEELKELAKYLKDLKFEQDNFNMSREKMEQLMNQPVSAVSIDELRAAIKRADAELRRMEGSLGENSSEYKRFSDQVRQAKNVMKEMEGQAKASATAWEKAFSRLKTYVVMYMGFNEVWQKITGTMSDMLELSDKMGEVRKTTGFTADQVARLSDNLKELDTRTSMVKLMELSSIAGSIGLKTQEQVEGFTDAANQLMVALPEMGSEAARTLMKIADATGDLEKNEGDVRETLERVGSTIIALRANSAAAAGPITDFVSRVGAVGAQAGISIDQIAALGATVDALGGRVEMSATALSRMIPAIRNNSFAVANAIGMAEQDLKKMTSMEQMVAIFKALRDSVKQFDTSTDEGMNAMADKVEQMLGNSTSMQEVMKTLNQQGARAGIVFGLLSQNVDKLEEQLTTATTAYEKNTALMDEYNRMNDTAAARWERLKNQLEEFFVTADNTSWLADIISGLRVLVDIITEEGPIGRFFRWSLVYLGMWQAGWTKTIGGALISLYQYIFATGKSTAATAADTAAKAANATATEAQAVASGKAAVAQGRFNATMKANIVAAVATAVVALGFALVSYIRKAKDAARQTGILEEAEKQARIESAKQRAELERLYKATQDQTKSMEERKNALKQMVGDAKYKEYYSKLNTESELAKAAAEAYKELATQIIATARARALDAKAEELQQRRIKLEDEKTDREQWRKENQKAYDREQAKNEAAVSQQARTETAGAAGVGSKMGYVHARNTGDTELISKYQGNEQRINRIDTEMGKIDNDLKKLEEQVKTIKPIAPGDGNGGGGGGGGGTNPYGQYDRVTDPYSKWNGDDLVERRKEMLVRVRALANGADVQKVLSEDAKFISEAVRKNIKTTEQAIEWYNAERLKIQEALYNKHLTPTGDWLDPKKGAKSWRKQLQTDFDNYLRILDAYYTERKAHIEKAQAEEGLSEAEAQRLTVENETVWRKHRMELQQIYLGKSADIAEEERQRIYDILAEQDEDSADMVEKQIAISINKLHLLAQKSEVEARKIETKLVKDIATDHYKQQNAVAKQMEAIEKIISEERPFNGLVDNLKKNLSTMGVLFADFNKKRQEAIERGEQPEDDMAERAKQTAKRLSVVLDGVPDAYRMTFDQLKEVMIKEGFGEWAKAIEGDEQLKLAMMAQIRKTYDQVQEAIRKEAALIKKHADNLWNDALTPDGKSMKNQFETAISQLGLQTDQVKRANSLIGAGVASDRVADRLVIQQMKVQLAMERARFALMHKIGEERIRQEQAVEESLRRQGKLEEAKRKHADIENMQKSLGLAISEEQKKVDEQRVAIQNQLEESQNRLYTELREWADLLTSGLQGMMEASHAGDAEYYNELAKLNLTGSGGPGAGTYVVIDNAGTSDATAHYEYLDERQALERQHEIEVQNAQAEAWEKLWDDINMKMSEQITDWMNAALQQQAVNENTAALKLNTDAEQRHLEVVSDENGIVEYNTDAVRSNTSALQGLTQQLMQGITIRPNSDGGTGSQQGGIHTAPDVDAPSFDENNPDTWPRAMRKRAGLPVGSNPHDYTGGNAAENASPFLPGVTPGTSWVLPEDMVAAEQDQLDQRVEMQREAAEKVRIANESAFQSAARAQKDSGNQMVKSSQSNFAKMTMAANLYGIAYQAVSNDNLSTTQKFQMMAVQAAGNAAISMLTTEMASASAKAATDTPGVLGTLWKQLGWAAAPVFAIFTGLLGGLMGLATSKIGKAKSEIAQATGTSVGAGRLATGMLTYAEGNVNELTDPASLTPGRQYNVDGADGKTYRAKYMGKGAKTHITNGPEFHLVGEAGREAIIDAKTTRLLQMNETGIWRDIQTLYNGGSISGLSTRRRRGGVRAFADGNIGEFEDIADGGGLTAEGTGGGMSIEMIASLQASIDRQSDLLENALTNGIKAVNKWTGSDGIPAMYNKMQKEAQRHGEKYL